MNNKIIHLNNLRKIITKEKKIGKKIVLCHGVFDLLHFGHINHFKNAKKNGDLLIVSITPDKFVKKGPGRPAFNQNIRAMSLSELNIVDYVTINTTHSAVNVIKTIKPNIFCKGSEYKIHKNDITSEIRNEVREVKSVGGKIVYTGGKTFSSSNLINRFGISNFNNSIP